MVARGCGEREGRVALAWSGPHPGLPRERLPQCQAGGLLMVNILKSRSLVAWVWGSERKFYWVNGCRCVSRKPGIRVCGFGSGLSAGPGRGELHLLRSFTPTGLRVSGCTRGKGAMHQKRQGGPLLAVRRPLAPGWVSSFPHRTRVLPFPLPRI